MIKKFTALKCECGVLNEKNVCNVLVKYKERKIKK